MLDPAASDAAYVVITRAKGKCAICSKPGANTALPIVPISYGGTDKQFNLQAAHARCAELRHRIEGSSPEPPDAENLRRLRTLMPDFVQGVLRRAAVAHRVRTYDSVDAVTLIGRAIEANLGYALRGRPCPPEHATEDWTWMQSSEAFSTLHDAAWALLASEG